MEQMEFCPVCGLNGVICDEENGQKVRVCTECGAMDDDMVDLQDDKSHEGTTRTDGQARGPDALRHRSYLKTDRRGLKLGRNVIRSLGPSLRFTKGMTEDAIRLYEGTYDLFLKCAKEDRRRAMCVACLYVVAKTNHFEIHVRNLGQYLNIPHAYRKFSQALNILKTEFDIKLPDKNVMNEAYVILSEKAFCLAEIRIVQQMIPLFERSWISPGRSTKTTLYVAAYYAWISQDYFNRRKMSYQKFCRDFKITVYKARKREIERLLQAMAKELPWVIAANGETVDVCLHLPDIIKYQNLLFDSALQTAVQNMKVEQDLIKDEDDPHVKDTRDIDQMEKHETVFKLASYNQLPKMQEDQENCILESLESMPKRRKLDPEDYGVDLGSDLDDDFDDIDQYLRTPKEIEQIKALYVKSENT